MGHNLVISILASLLSQSLVVAALFGDRPACEISMRVDPALPDSADWSSDYSLYSMDRKSYNGTLNLTFTDLQVALLALNTTISHQANSCIEVAVSAGNYMITSSVYLLQNVRFIGEEIGQVYVEFNLTVPRNARFFNALTFYGSDYVEIHGFNFSSSPGTISVERVSQVYISDCSFQWFARGAVDIYQCFIIQVHRCTFESNGFVGVTKSAYQYRGHAGGLSVGFDDNHYNPNGLAPSVRLAGLLISDCAFRNNTSDPQESVSTTELLQRFVFTGRGGAVAITINSSFAFDSNIQNCTFEDNFALSFGGGLYLGFSGHAAHTTVINNTVFAGNRCIGPAGGVQIGFIEGSDNSFIVRLELYNSEFYNNSALFGGGVHLFANQSSSVDGVPQVSQVAHVESCTFKRNNAQEFGAALCLNSLLFLVDTSNIQSLTIVDCVFTENDGGRAGVLSTAYLPLSFHGDNVFSNNSGRVLVVSGTRAEIHGTLEFQSNDGTGIDSAALYVTSFGQLIMYAGANLVFQSNTGVLGASVVVDAVSSFAGGYSRALYNPLCVIRSENETDSPQDWQDVSISFSGNKALLGSAVLMNSVNACSWIDTGPRFFDSGQVFRWDFVKFTEDNANSAHDPQQTNPLWYVQTLAESLTSNTHNLTAYPGQLFSVNTTGVDQFGEPTTAAIRLTDVSGDYSFSPSAAAPELIRSSNILTKYSLATKNPLQQNSKVIRISTIFSDRSLRVTFTLAPRPCPVGYVLSQSGSSGNVQYSCECNDRNNLHIRSCPSRDETIILTDGLWGIESPDGSDDRLATYPCPQHYCQCLSLNDQLEVTCNYLLDPSNPDRQCHCSRKGVLCGSCRNESAGFTALLNNCETCGYPNILLIFALFILDGIVIGALLFVKKSAPCWIYPSLFYLQILPYLTLHFPVTFEAVHPYVYYVSSAMSLYFIYDFCLGPQFSAMLVYFIRFIPILISVIITLPIVVLRYRYKKVNERWPGLWWLILLQYTHVIYTCMSVLNCPMLPGRDGVIKPRWYINGDVTCFTGGHIPLALFSIAVLAVCIAAIPLSLVYNMGWFKRPRWLYYALVTSSDAYKKKLSWWSAMELARRVLILIFALAFPATDWVVIFCLAVFVGVFLFVQPYQSLQANILEGFLAVDVLVLLLIRSIDVNSLISGNGSIQTVFSSLNVSDETCVDSRYHGITISTAVLTPGYYIPLVVFILASCISVVLAIRSFCVKYIQKKRLAIRRSTSNEFTDSYHLMGDERAPYTSTVVEADRHRIPLSTILPSIYGERTTKPKDNPGETSKNKFSSSLNMQSLHSTNSQPSDNDTMRSSRNSSRDRSSTSVSLYEEY